MITAKKTAEFKALLNFVKTEAIRLIPLFFLDWIIPKNKNLFLYGAFAGNLYGENSRFLFEYAVKHEPQIKHYWVTSNKDIYVTLKTLFPDNIIYARSLKGLFIILRAKVIFVSDHITDVYYFLTKRHLIINLWHGAPLKRIGYFRKTKGHWAFRFAKLLYKNKYSYIVASSTSEKFFLSQAFSISPNKMIITGMPRNDTVNCSPADEIFAHLKNYKKVILYAPTLRNNEAPKFFPFDDFEISKLKHFLIENNICLLLRAHKGNTVSKGSRMYERTWQANDFRNMKNIQLLGYDELADVNTIFSKIDVLITDYSTIFYDFLLTNRPVMFIPYDLNEYEDEVGFLFEYDCITPGPKVNSFMDFQKEISRLFDDNEYFAAERRFVRNLIFKYQDNKARNRIMNFVKGLIEQKQ